MHACQLLDDCMHLLAHTHMHSETETEKDGTPTCARARESESKSEREDGNRFTQLRAYVHTETQLRAYVHTEKGNPLQQLQLKAESVQGTLN